VLRGAKIYLKRDDLNYTGAHKTNNCMGQILLARLTRKRRIIAETGAGQHGVATATVSARFGLPCVIYMGEVDMAQQRPNVFRMRLLGAEVRAVTSGSRTLKDAMNEAIRDWVTYVADTYHLISSVAGPHPYPELVRDFQAVIGHDTRSGPARHRLRTSCRFDRRPRFECAGPIPPVPRRQGRRDVRRWQATKLSGRRPAEADIARGPRRAKSCTTSGAPWKRLLQMRPAGGTPIPRQPLPPALEASIEATTYRSPSISLLGVLFCGGKESYFRFCL
jgi:hypothetical protein